MHIYNIYIYIVVVMTQSIKGTNFLQQFQDYKRFPSGVLSLVKWVVGAKAIMFQKIGDVFFVCVWRLSQAVWWRGKQYKEILLKQQMLHLVLVQYSSLEFWCWPYCPFLLSWCFFFSCILYKKYFAINMELFYKELVLGDYQMMLFGIGLWQSLG